jgi:hypothetical protein
VVLAQDAAAAGECIVLKLAGLLVLAHGSQSDAEDIGGAQRDVVILAEGTAAAGERLGLQLPSLLMFPQGPEGKAEKAE